MGEVEATVLSERSNYQTTRSHVPEYTHSRFLLIIDTYYSITRRHLTEYRKRNVTAVIASDFT
jgi:hypothetical protein